MKMLILFKLKDTFRQLPMETQRALAEKWIPWVDKYRRAGDCKAAYLVPLQGGLGMFLWEFVSFEAADALTLEMPLYPWLEITVYNLSDWDFHQKAAKEMFERIIKK